MLTPITIKVIHYTDEQHDGVKIILLADLRITHSPPSLISIT